MAQEQSLLDASEILDKLRQARELVMYCECSCFSCDEVVWGNELAKAHKNINDVISGIIGDPNNPEFD